MDPSRIDQVLQFALAAAAQEDAPSDRELGPIHLIKYVYLADLAHAEAHYAQTFTAVPWRFYHFGPWALEVHDRIERATEAVSAERRTFESAKYEGEFVRYRVVDDMLYERLQRQLPGEVVSAVRRAVHEFGSDTPSLLQHVYLTRPMLKAAPGELLFGGHEPAAAPEAARSMSVYPATPDDRILFDLGSSVEYRASAIAGPSEGATAEAAAPPHDVPYPGPPSLKARRERKLAVAKLRDEVRTRLERRLSRPAIPVRPPRYDEVFFDGIAWLDEQSGGPIEPFEGEAAFSPDIWKSPGRSDPDVS